MNKTIRIALACFLGAALGTILSLRFSGRFVWLGILLGGLMGYLAYDFRRVCCAFRTAWNRMCEEFSSKAQKFPSDSGLMKKLESVCEELSEALFRMVCIVVPVLVLGLTWTLPINLSVEPRDRVDLGDILFASFVFGMVGVCLVGSTHQKDNSIKTVIKKACLWCNPFSICFLLVPAIFIVLARKTPDRIVLRFVARIFRLIHSDIRLLCMTDAVIGALVGYGYESPIIGGLVGAVVGVLNYRLVSIRWLKLVPA